MRQLVFIVAVLQVASAAGATEMDALTKGATPTGSNQIVCSTSSTSARWSTPASCGIASSPLSGSGANGQVTYWSGASSLTGAAGFTFNGTTLVAPNVTASTAMNTGSLAATGSVSGASVTATGTVQGSTVASTGPATVATTLTVTGASALNGGASLNGQKITGLANGVAASDAATVGQLPTVSGYNSGSGAANQVAYYTAVNTQTSSSNLTFNGAALALIGTQTISSTLGVTGATTLGALTETGASAALKAGADLNSQKITNLANGSAASDAAAFGQIPSVATYYHSASSGASPHLAMFADGYLLSDSSGTTPTWNGTLAVTGAETISTTLGVTGAATLGSLTVNNGSTHTGATTLTGGVTIGSGGSAIANSKTTTVSLSGTIGNGNCANFCSALNGGQGYLVASCPGLPGSLIAQGYMDGASSACVRVCNASPTVVTGVSATCFVREFQ